MDSTLTVLGVVEKDPGERNGDPGADDKLFRLQVDSLVRLSISISRGRLANSSSSCCSHGVVNLMATA